MFSMVQKRRWFYLFSSAVIIPGLLIMVYSLVTTGKLFRLSIDFEGGSIYELKFTGPGATESNIRNIFAGFGDDSVIIQQIGDPTSYRWSVRSSLAFNESQTEQITDALNQLAPLDRDSFRQEDYRQHLE